MIVRLHNLSVRAPLRRDLGAVTKLMVACSQAETAVEDYVEGDMKKTWEAPDFNITTDAWVIVTRDGQIVGYAEVRKSEGGNYTALLRVHPDYRGRGIGTLLIWLVEERARQLVANTQPCMRVALQIQVSSLNRAACNLLRREGYTRAQSFWRLVIEVDEMPEFYQHGKLKVDLYVDSERLIGTTQPRKRTGFYTAHQYIIYEKQLCTRNRQDLDECPELSLTEW